MGTAPAQKQAVALSPTAVAPVADSVSGEEFPELLLRGVSKPAGSLKTSPRGL